MMKKKRAIFLALAAGGLLLTGCSHPTNSGDGEAFLKISSITPEDGATGVAAEGLITIVFNSELKDPENGGYTWPVLISTGFKFGVESGGNDAVGKITRAEYDAAAKKLTLTCEELANNKKYFLTIAGLYDTTGNRMAAAVEISFTTTAEGPDLAPPEVTGPGSTGGLAAGEGSIVIVFDEDVKTGSGPGEELADGAVDWAALTGAGFKFGVTSGGDEMNDKITGAVYTRETNTLTLNYSGLENGTEYRLIIAGLYDTAGNKMATAVRTFTTAPDGLDAAPPVVGNTSPADGLAVAGNIVISFNEDVTTGNNAGEELAGGAVDWAALTGAGFKFGVTSGGDEVNDKITGAVYTRETNMLTLSYSGLESGTEYWLTIAGLYDTAGNEMEVTVKKFTTAGADEKTVSVQETALTYGIAGSASFTVTTTNIAEGAKAAVAWSNGEAPAGVTDNSAGAVVSGDSLTLTLTTTAETPAGNYSFTVIIDGVMSGPAALRVAKADITITFSIADDDFAGFPAETPVIYKDGDDGTAYKKTLNVTLTGAYTSHAWYVDGVEVSGANGAGITLDAANYSARKHTLTVRVVKEGKPYSKEINFGVKNSVR